MIYSLHNQDNLVFAYVVFTVVNHKGEIENNGQYIYIQDMWIHENYRNGKTLKLLIEYIDSHPETQQAHSVYWNRLKYGRISKVYPVCKFQLREFQIQEK